MTCLHFLDHRFDLFFSVDDIYPETEMPQLLMSPLLKWSRLLPMRFCLDETDSCLRKYGDSIRNPVKSGRYPLGADPAMFFYCSNDFLFYIFLSHFYLHFSVTLTCLKLCHTTSSHPETLIFQGFPVYLSVTVEKEFLLRAKYAYYVFCTMYFLYFFNLLYKN